MEVHAQKPVVLTTQSVGSLLEKINVRGGGSEGGIGGVDGGVGGEGVLGGCSGGVGSEGGGGDGHARRKHDASQPNVEQ